MSKKSKTSVRLGAPSAQETELQGFINQLVGGQAGAAAPALQQLTQQQQIRGGLFTPEEQEARVRQQQEFEDQLAPIQQELLQRELDRIRQGPGATAEQRGLIEQATQAAIASGEADISEFRRQGLEQIREEFAPASGLRPGDTPVVERGLQLGREAARQQGQLVRGLRGQQAQQLLQFPLQAGAAAQQQSIGAQGLGQAAQQFQTQLRQQAFQNQLRLSGQATQASLGGLQVAQTPRLAQPTQRGTQRDPFRALGAVGGGLQGLGAVGFGNVFGSRQ